MPSCEKKVEEQERSGGCRRCPRGRLGDVEEAKSARVEMDRLKGRLGSSVEDSSEKRVGGKGDNRENGKRSSQRPASGITEQQYTLTLPLLSPPSSPAVPNPFSARSPSPRRERSTAFISAECAPPLDRVRRSLKQGVVG
jgi:hypothetical protein